MLRRSLLGIYNKGVMKCWNAVLCLNHIESGLKNFLSLRNMELYRLGSMVDWIVFKLVRCYLIYISFLSVYRGACKKICFVCNGVFKPKDMFVYVLFEIFIYTLRCKYNYEVEYSIREAKTHIHAPGLKDSLLLYFYNDKFDKKLMEKIIVGYIIVITLGA